MAVPTRAQVDEMIRERLSADPGFRDRLLATPRETLGELVGVPLPGSVAVEVHEETLTRIHVVLPAVPGAGEMSDDDLELVAGGGTCWDNCACSM